MPVPEPVIGVLAGQVGGSAARLRGLGLLDPYPDLHDPARPALAADPLAAGRHRRRSPPASRPPWPPSAPGRCSRPGAGRRRSPAVIWRWICSWPGSPCSPMTRPWSPPAPPGAVTALRAGPAADAFRLGQDAIELLDRHGRAVPLDLLRRSADAALTSGDGQAGEALLNRAAQQAEAGDEQGTGPLDQARVIAERGPPPHHPRRTWTRPSSCSGTPASCSPPGGSELEAAAAMGTIARHRLPAGRLRRGAADPPRGRAAGLRAPRRHPGSRHHLGQDRGHRLPAGDYDEALRIRREVQLPAFERLGDTREAAIAWGKIADIAYQRGDYDEALRIRREVELPAYERLGDTREAAITWGKIADIAYQRGTTTRRCGSAARSSCRPTSASATPGQPPSPGARSRTSPTSGATTTRQLSCSASGWR